MASYRLSTAARNAACNAVVDLLDSGTIECRTGAQPTNVGDADSGTLLGTLTFAATAFGDAAVGVATAAAITSDSDADASGDCAHVRIKTSAPAIHSDADAGEAGASPSVVFDNNTIVAGGTIAISALTITQPI
jgi:hypothetical protein